jgi:deoxyadenosine/deoxycytidine kinase
MLVFLEGSIGSGKSTLLSKLEARGHTVIYEPVDAWMNMRVNPTSESLFDLYYKDKKRYGFMFQMVALQSRIAHINEIISRQASTSNDTILICERSFFTDHQVFAKMLHEEIIITDEEYYVYKMWYDYLLTLINPKVSGIIYLKASPEVCMSRIIKRNRKGEEGIDLEYLVRLDRQHENWLVNEPPNLPVHVIDGNVEDLDVTQDLVDFLDTLVIDKVLSTV